MLLKLALTALLPCLLHAEILQPVTETPLCLEFQEKASGQTKADFIKYMNRSIPNSTELLARLIYAEGISTQFSRYCESQGKAIFEAIGWGVVSRLRIELAKGLRTTLRQEILAPGQYNPSTSLKSPFRKYFACPSIEDPKNDFKSYWNWARAAAEKAVKHPEQNPFLKTSCKDLNDKDYQRCLTQQEWERKYEISLVTNFFYPRSTQAGVVPPWAQVKDYHLVRGLVVNGTPLSEASTSCIQFFRHQSAQAMGTPKWRVDIHESAEPKNKLGNPNP